MIRFAVSAAILLLAPLLVAQSVATGFALDVIQDPVANARAMVFAPDGRLFYVENISGRIMVFNTPIGSTAPVEFVTLGADFVAPTGNDLGVHGICLHPNFPASGAVATDRFIYVCYATGTAGAPNLEVKRYQEDIANLGQPVSTIATPIVAAISMGSAANNFGGRIGFGPDNRLYVTVGDGGAAVNLAGAFAQDVSDRRGKILRYADDGSIPLNNPLTGNAMWARGLRNPRGFAFNPANNDLFGVDQGNPATSGVDELNVITSAGNYGWDVNGQSGQQTNVNYTNPAWDFPAAFDPSCVAFHPTGATAFPPLGYRTGVVYVGSEAASGSVTRVVLTGGAERHGIANWTLAQGFSGAIRDIKFGPDGHLYVMASNVLYRIRYVGNVSSNDPVADAGVDQTVNENTLVTLDGSASFDADVSDVLRFTWRQVGGATLITLANPTTAMPTFTAPDVTFDQSFTFELIIEDGSGGVDNDFVIINVTNIGNTGGDGVQTFSPQGEGGCSTGENPGWWWIGLLGLAAVVALRARRAV